MGANKSSLSPSDLKDLSRETAFSEREIRTWFRSFKRDCPSGKLTLKEFKQLYSQFFPLGDPTEFAKHAFRTFDDNNDGTIDFREFMCALSVTMRGSFEEKLEWAYSMYDKDQDGHVTKAEMLDIFNSIYKMIGDNVLAQVTEDGLTPQQRVDKLFQKVDKNGDQKITLKEFKLAARTDPSLVMLLQINGSGEEDKASKSKSSEKEKMK